MKVTKPNITMRKVYIIHAIIRAGKAVQGKGFQSGPAYLKLIPAKMIEIIAQIYG
jgi:hypothetical protein